ncbi:YdaE family protein, partial [Escherichia coli]
FLPEKAFTGELIYMHGNMIARKKRKYCGAACAEKDKMAHEL